MGLPDAGDVPVFVVRRSRAVFHRSRRGFTLIEFLTVFAVIGILVSITITAGRGILERGKINRAKAEMAVIAAALEQYKQHYGDYPWTPTAPPFPTGFPPLDPTLAASYESVILFNALCGNMGPKSAGPLATRGRSFVELSKLTLWHTNADLPDPDAATNPALLNNWFMDPWGKWYYYVYKKSGSDAAWKSPSFLLYSHGPDRDCNLGPADASGFLTDVPGDAINADNVYYGRN